MEFAKSSYENICIKYKSSLMFDIYKNEFHRSKFIERAY